MTLISWHYLNSHGSDFLDLEALHLGLQPPTLRDAVTYQRTRRSPRHSTQGLPVVAPTISWWPSFRLKAARWVYEQLITNRISPSADPNHTDSDLHVDIYIPWGVHLPQERRQPYVMDVTFVHPFTGSGTHIQRKVGRTESLQEQQV